MQIMDQFSILRCTEPYMYYSSYSLLINLKFTCLKQQPGISIIKSHSGAITSLKYYKVGEHVCLQ